MRKYTTSAGIYLGVTLAICVVGGSVSRRWPRPHLLTKQARKQGSKAEQVIILDVAPKNINISTDFEGAVVTVFGTILPQKGEGETTQPGYAQPLYGATGN